MKGKKEKPDRRGTCRHCGRSGLTIAGRGLCGSCYANLDIRWQYPSQKERRQAREVVLLVARTWCEGQADKGAGACSGEGGRTMAKWIGIAERELEGTTSHKEEIPQ